MNILLTSAGRQSHLVCKFKAALGGKGDVFVADSNADAPALKEADFACVLPHPLHGDYVDTLLELCVKRSIRLLVPLSMAELPVIAQHRARFLNVGTLPLVPSKAITHICYDRMATDEFLRELEIASPKSYPSLATAHDAICTLDLKFPAIVQSRWGVTSLAPEIVLDAEEMDLAACLLHKRLQRTTLPGGYALCADYSVLIQQHVAGREYMLQIINDLDGRYVTTFVSRRLNTHPVTPFGHSERAITEINPRLELLGQLIGQKLGHIGCLSCHVLVTARESYVRALTPLIGPEYLLLSAAGVNLPAVLIAWVKGERPNPKWLQAEPNTMSAFTDRVELLARQTPPPGEGSFLLVKP